MESAANRLRVIIRVEKQANPYFNQICGELRRCFDNALNETLSADDLVGICNDLDMASVVSCIYYDFRHDEPTLSTLRESVLALFARVNSEQIAELCPHGSRMLLRVAWNRSVAERQWPVEQNYRLYNLVIPLLLSKTLRRDNKIGTDRRGHTFDGLKLQQRKQGPYAKLFYDSTCACYRVDCSNKKEALFHVRLLRCLAAEAAHQAHQTGSAELMISIAYGRARVPLAEFIRRHRPSARFSLMEIWTCGYRVFGRLTVCQLTTNEYS